MIDYRDPSGVEYKPTREQVFPCLPVCQYLWGSPWNELALAAVSTLRPSRIRVVRSTDFVNCDGVWWRVTVYLNEDSTIESVEQEVAADVGDQVKNGHDLRVQLRALIGWPNL